MNTIKYLIAAAFGAIAIIFTACEPAANTVAGSAAAANANTNTAAATASAPSTEALIALERSAFEAWKTKDAKFWEAYVSDKFAGIGPGGRMNKSDVLKHFASDDCQVDGYSLSEETLMPLGASTALLTYKATADAVCGKGKMPLSAWVATVFGREGGSWKALFHGESPIHGPNAKLVPAGKPARRPASKPAAPAAPADPATDTLLALEKTAWDAWKNHDAKAMNAWAGPDLVAFTYNGRQHAPEAVSSWTNDGCDVRSVKISEASTVALTPDHTVLFFKAEPDAACGGQPTPPEYGATIYARSGASQKPLFTMGSPIM